MFNYKSFNVAKEQRKAVGTPQMSFIYTAVLMAERLLHKGAWKTQDWETSEKLKRKWVPIKEYVGIMETLNQGAAGMEGQDKDNVQPNQTAPCTSLQIRSIFMWHKDIKINYNPIIYLLDKNGL